MGDVRLTFAGTLEIPGEIVYVHPLHNLAVIHYDPKLIGTHPGASAAKLDTAPLKAGETVNVVGLDGNGELKSRTTTHRRCRPAAAAAVALGAVSREQSGGRLAGECTR